MLSNLKKLPIIIQRVLVATFISGAGILLLFYSPNQFFIGFVAFLFCVILFEYSCVLTQRKFSNMFFLLIIFAGLRLVNFFSNSDDFFSWFNNQAVVVIILLLLVSFFRKGKLAFLFLFLLAIAWIILPFLILVNLTFFAEAKKLIVFLIVIITVHDSLAYFVGKKWGKKKLAPTISPNKTYLGSFAGLLGAILSAFIINEFWQLFEASQVLIFAVALGVFAQIGDLLESKFKRNLNIKDTGSILLAHGGVLDRADALLLCIPVYYYLLYFFGYR